MFNYRGIIFIFLILNASCFRSNESCKVIKVLCSEYNYEYKKYQYEYNGPYDYDLAVKVKELGIPSFRHLQNHDYYRFWYESNDLSNNWVVDFDFDNKSYNIWEYSYKYENITHGDTICFEFYRCDSGTLDNNLFKLIGNKMDELNINNLDDSIKSSWLDAGSFFFIERVVDNKYQNLTFISPDLEYDESVIRVVKFAKFLNEQLLVPEMGNNRCGRPIFTKK
ncbi:hypothetical protein [Polluticaenibacter yanchengensis]|uniref:Uncharacterized protein n=1 Tax=Polluticaenibacter yanchengensis TaxID=3014562 RepID=A0ABT4UPW0_9BACT|nr:hypothetical protein [Chitinophagaceae bacterium LY-5]